MILGFITGFIFGTLFVRYMYKKHFVKPIRDNFIKNHGHLFLENNFKMSNCILCGNKLNG